MDELRDRFAALERISVPDLWADIERRVSDGAAASGVQGQVTWRAERAPHRLSPMLILLLLGLLLSLALALFTVGSWLPKMPPARAIPDTGGHMHLELDPGEWYADHGFPFRVELSLPPLPSGRWEGDVTRPPQTSRPWISISTDSRSAELEIAIVEEVYVDSCDSLESPRRPIGSSDDLLAWLARLADGAGSEPTAVAVGDLHGWQVGGLFGACRQTGEAGVRTYSLLADGLWLAPHAPSTVTVVEVGGAVVAIRAMVDPADQDAAGPAVASAMSSIRFRPSVEDGPAPTPLNPWPGRTLEPGVTPRHSPEDVEAKVMALIQRSEQIVGRRLAEPRIRVTLLTPGDVYITYSTDGSPSGGTASNDGLAWVAEFEGTFVYRFIRRGTVACTAGVILYHDVSLQEGAVGCRDVNPRPLASPGPSVLDMGQ